MTKELAQAEEILDRAMGLWLDEGCDIAEHIAEALAEKNKAIGELEELLVRETECEECFGEGIVHEAADYECPSCDGLGCILKLAAAKRLVTAIKARPA